MTKKYFSLVFALLNSFLVCNLYPMQLELVGEPIRIPENCSLVVTKWNNASTSPLLGVMNSHHLQIINLQECLKLETLNAYVANEQKDTPYYLSIASNDDIIAVQTVDGLLVYHVNGDHQEFAKTWRTQSNPGCTSQIGLKRYDNGTVIVDTMKLSNDTLTHSIDIHSIPTQHIYNTFHLSWILSANILKKANLTVHPYKNKVAFLLAKKEHIKHSFIPEKILRVALLLLVPEIDGDFEHLFSDVRRLICTFFVSIFRARTCFAVRGNHEDSHSVEYNSDGVLSFCAEEVLTRYPNDPDTPMYYNVRKKDSKASLKSFCTFGKHIFATLHTPGKSNNAIVTYQDTYSHVSKSYLLSKWQHQGLDNQQQLVFSPCGKKLFIVTQNHLLCFNTGYIPLHE